MGKQGNLPQGIGILLVRRLEHNQTFNWRNSYDTPPIENLKNYQTVSEIDFLSWLACRQYCQNRTHQVAALIYFQRRWKPPSIFLGTFTRLVIILMMTPHQVLLNNIEILNIIFFQIFKVEPFIQFCLSCALKFELSTYKSYLVSELDINSPTLQKLLTSTLLWWDLAM